MPCEKKFIAGMTALHEIHSLNVDVSADTCGESELHLVGATGTKYKNTKDIETVNYKGMMESPRKEMYEEGMEVEHEKFDKYNCWDKRPRADLLPGDEVIDGTWASRFKPCGGLPCCRMAARGFKQRGNPPLGLNRLAHVLSIASSPGNESVRSRLSQQVYLTNFSCSTSIPSSYISFLGLSIMPL